MKVFRYIAVLFSITILMLMQACGGGKSDTSGALTMTAPTLKDNGDGTFFVSTTVSYAPPAGKTAQGVVITTTLTDSFGVVQTDNATLTSGSNSVNYSFPVAQQIGVSNRLSIVASIGDMNASTGIVIPGISPLSALPIDFIAGEAASPGTTKTTTISGGVGTYILTSPSTVDGVLTISLAGNTLTVKYISTTTLAPFTTSVTIRDGVGATFTIPVSYFK